MIGRSLAWIGRRGALFLLLVAALLLWQARGEVGAFFGISPEAPQAYRAHAVSLERAAAEVEARRKALQESLRETAAEANAGSVAEIRGALQEARGERQRLIGRRRPAWQQARSLATFNKEEIVGDRTLELEIEVLGRKITGLQALLSSIDRSAGARERAETALRSCRAARARLQDFDDDFVLLREAREVFGRERTRLKRQAQERCYLARNAARQWRALRSEDAGSAWNTRLTDRTADLVARAEEQRSQAEGTLRARFERFWHEWRVEQVLWTAAGLLLAILLLPYAIRLLFYFVLAPLAERRGSIRLRVPGGISAPVPPAERSSTSVAVRLAAGEELLVRQDYLQSSPLEAVKSTRWLLDPRHPLSSLAAGLWFLTRIRGEGQATTISTVRDPFAEVTVLVLPPGASCVLQPRALAAVVVSQGKSLRITSHWRLFSLNAWLTLQLRYLVFHGPARLVLKGGRGVRVEQAEQGRIFAQDQLIGFSADLAYSVARTETFWPYFFGRESLLKDQIEGGRGVLIIEEAPLALRTGAAGRRGLEGTLDAALKAVGL